ncbi:helix-turn-helix transcriptional regulator [Pseudohongiella acticola]|uniref:helix-turn-helix transcriptional regulator n=1 Tax=Pseudohongiella acticola TaxID=1524254 RepID=UPI0030EBDDDA
MIENKDNFIGLRLASERKRVGYSQKYLGDLLKTTTRTIGRWEQGDSIPSDKLVLLQDLDFNVPFILFGGRASKDNYLESPEANITGRREVIDSGLLAEIMIAVEQIVDRKVLSARWDAKIKAKVVAHLYKNYSAVDEKPRHNDPALRAMIDVLLGD